MDEFSSKNLGSLQCFRFEFRSFSASPICSSPFSSFQDGVRPKSQASLSSLPIGRSRLSSPIVRPRAFRQADPLLVRRRAASVRCLGRWAGGPAVAIGGFAQNTCFVKRQQVKCIQEKRFCLDVSEMF